MKAHKDKIRATFYIDKKLYQLLKRCSQIEGIPMSSIINEDILQQRVGQYELPTPEHLSGYEDAMAERAEQRENELYYEQYEASPEGQRDSRVNAINTMLKSGKTTDEDAKKQILIAEEKYQVELKKEREEEERRKKEYHDKWLKAVKEIPID